MLHVRPCGSEAFVRHPPKQQRVAGEQQVGLELRQLVIPIQIGPPADLNLANPAGVFSTTFVPEMARLGYEEQRPLYGTRVYCRPD